jgi:protein-S-isoprenylcysteine O-methyltransferase Ste14
METLSILLPALAIGVIILMLVEFRAWRAGRSVISAGQIALRMVGGAILLALLAAIFLGLFILHLRNPHGQPIVFLAWWTGCLILAIGLLFLALEDMRHVEQRQREQEHQIWREFARMMAERMGGSRGDKPPGTPDERG